MRLDQAMSFYAYLLRCNDGSYYAGHTDDLEARMAQHQSGLIGGYTAERLPVALVWSDNFPTREEALIGEERSESSGRKPSKEGTSVTARTKVGVQDYDER